MKQENIDFLEANMQHLVNARNEFFKNLGGETRLRFEQIISQEFRPGYKADIFCDKCCLEMMKILDIHYRQWKDRQPPPLETVPITGEPVTVDANFPSHKKKVK